MKETENSDLVVPTEHRILVVDDNADIHADFRKVLCPAIPHDSATAAMETALFDDEQKGQAAALFQVDTALQGKDALDLVNQAMNAKRPYSLAFVDVRMPPGWDGIETISRLWQTDPDLQIVVCTAYSDYSWEGMRAKLSQPDNMVVLKKPFEAIVVRQLAHALCRKWTLNLQARLKLEELEQMVHQRTASLEAANLELARSEERFEKAFHTSPVAMAIQSLADRRFVDVNACMTELVGYTKEELISSSFNDHSIWPDTKQPDTWFGELQKEELIRDQETEVVGKSGQHRQVSISLSRINLGGLPHALCVAQDITERKLLEKQIHQEQKMEAMCQLAAGVAHDFNSILSIVQASAEAIQTDIGPSHPAREHADKVIKAATRASGLIRQLIAFSRKQAAPH